MALICSYCGSECGQRDQENGRCGSCACFFTGNEEVIPDATPAISQSDSRAASPLLSPDTQPGDRRGAAILDEQNPGQDLPDSSDQKSHADNDSQPNRPAPPRQFDPTEIEHDLPQPEIASSEGLIQPRRLSPQFRRRVEQTWQSTFGGGAFTAESTLSSNQPSSGTKVENPTLSIATRKITKANNGSNGASEGDYELTDVIGEGSMGRVWSARQTSLDRNVAVKVPMAELTGSGSVGESQFISEVVVTGQLEHPNIVPIYELGRDATGVPFYSMKHVQGRPWNEFIDEKSDAENLEILMKVCDAIAFAHDRNFLHRDIKPHNVMVGEFGEVSVMDWGIAVSITKDPNQPWASIATGPAGTPAYMAPEMAAHNPSELGVVSDIYLLGAVLYEIVTGTPPHPKTGDTGEALLAAAANEIIPTTRTGELVDIARRAMATNLDDRYQSVQELQDAIREYQSHRESIKLSESADEHFHNALEQKSSDEFARSRFAFEEALRLWDGNQAAVSGLRLATLAHAKNALAQENYELGISVLDPENPEHRELLSKLETKRAARRRLAWFSKIAAATAIAAVLTVVGVTLFFYMESLENAKSLENQRDIARKQEGLATKAKTKAEIEKENAEEARNEAFRAQRVARRLEAEARLEKRRAEEAPYSSEVGLAAESIRRKLRDKAEKILDKLDPTKPDADPVMSQLRHIEWGLLKHSWGPSSVATLTAKDQIQAVASSRDAAVVAAGTEDGNVLVWTGVTSLDQKAQPTSIRFGAKISSIAVSDDGRFLAAAGIRRSDPDREAETEDFDVCLWELTQADGAPSPAPNLPPQQLHGHKAEVLSVSFSSDSSKVVTSAADRTAVVWDRNSGRRLAVMSDHLDPKVWQATFSPRDANLVVTACEDGRVRVWKTSSGSEQDAAKKIYDFRGHDGPVYAAVFSPDGNSVISGGVDRRLLRWKLSSAQSDVVAAGTDLLIKRLRGEADEARLDTGGEDSIGAPADQHTASIRSIAVDRLGDQPCIVTAGNDNTVRVWIPEGDDWELNKVLSGHGRWVRSCDFSNNGKFVLSGASDGLKLWSWQDYAMPQDLIPDPEVRLSRQPSERGLSSALRSIYSKDGRWVATVYANGTVEVWDLADPGRATGTMLVQGHSMLAATGEMDPSGRRLLTSAGDNTTRLWDVLRGTHALKLDGTGYRGAADVAWRPGQETTWVVTGSDDRMTPAWFWKVNSSGKTSKIPLLDDHARSQLAQQTQALAERRGAGVSDANATEGLSAKPDLGDIERLRRRIPDVTATAFTPDGSQFAVGDSAGHCFVFEIDPQDGLPRQRVQFRAHGSAVGCIAFLPSGRSVFTAGVDGEVVKWNASDGARETKLPWSGPVTAMDLSSDGNELLVGHAPLEGTEFPIAELYRIADGGVQLDATFELTDASGKRNWADNRPTIRSARFVSGTDNALLSLFFPARGTSDKNAADGQVGSSRYRVGLWNWTAKGSDFAEVKSSKLGEVSSASLVTGGDRQRQLLVVGGKGARLLASEKDQSLTFSALKKSFRPAARIVSCDFAFDPERGISDRLVVGDAEGNVRVWELNQSGWSETSEAAVHLAGEHDGPIVSTYFDPTDPNRMITADRTGTWKKWDFDGSQWRSDFSKRSGTDELNFAMFAPDGKQILVGMDSGASVWVENDAGALEQSLPNWKPGKLKTAVYSEDGSWIVTCDAERSVAFWDLKGNLLARMDEEDARGTTALALSYDRRRLVTGQGKGIGIWDTSRILDAIAPVQSQRQSLQIETATTGADGLIKELFTLNKKLFRLDTDSEVNAESDVTSISISPNGQDLLSSGMNGLTTIWKGDPLYPITFDFSNNQYSVRRNSPPVSIGESAFLSDPSRIAEFTDAELVVSIRETPLEGERFLIQPRVDALGATVVAKVEPGQTKLYHRAHHNAILKPIGSIIGQTEASNPLRISLDGGVDVRQVQSLIQSLAYRIDSTDRDAPSTENEETEPEESPEAVEMSVIERTVDVVLSGVGYPSTEAADATDQWGTIRRTISIEVEPESSDDL